MAKKSEKEYAPFMAKCKASGGSTCPCCGNEKTEEIEDGGGFNCNQNDKCPLSGESWLVHKRKGKIEIELPYFMYE